MEGLFIARIVQSLQRRLPARAGGWAFPDETTAALLLEGVGNLVFAYRPPAPALYFSDERLRGEASGPFQRMLASRAKGSLLSVEQLKLDRVVMLHFSGESGFVDTPPVRLVFELTGRNANLLLLDAGEGWEGRVIGAAREITSSRNRYRSVRSGSLYVPPPPYEKLDPRTATDTELAALAGVPIGRWHARVDGLGPSLSAELASRAALPLDQPPLKRLPEAVRALRGLVEDPSLRAGTLSEQARTVSRDERALGLRKALREPLEKRLTLLGNQIGDLERAREGALIALQEREWADLLMAYQHTIEPGLSEAVLPDFYGGEPVRIPLEPQLSALHNAEKLYARARRREEVLTRLEERAPELEAERARVAALLAEVEAADLERLEAMSRDLSERREEKSPFGQRFVSPSGFEVLVGRNNKENDYLTHRLGRSMDYWFHAQGYPGSHVLVRTGPRDLPLEDILEVAAIAAYHSKARNSGNVPVDYTRIKHVWRPRGAARGQVNYTQQKTVFVDPRLPEPAQGSR
ncbi:putative ribosome quality control (RQC) complex YloA/Tae2 family protein [Deinobacterium chartae]|uniref:Putative ribosome quality control (RQC) complex YloA/Tae2 family protein n=1 Tax=Deinobacterium chartae TaxID=521158 RepID=A0A841HW14_9DEIO|nr:NFACT family protein [Deinobacterium chartae]MBB6097721.1 putative ribosome quality control (RQC) complex YloA/Tae2 family protein [Deinobacterium chartae]